MDAGAVIGGHGRAELGENSPVGRDGTDVAQHPGAAFDPVALEDRIRIAREQRAEALARRQAAARAQQPPPTPRPALRGPAPQPIEPAQVPAAPALSGARRRPASTERPAAPRVAHPLVALLALSLTVSYALSRGAPEAPPVEVAVLEASRKAVPAAAPATPRPGSAPVDAGVLSPAAPVDAPNPADPPHASDAPVTPEAEAPAPPQQAATAEPAPAAPRPERILVNAPASVPPDSIDATLAALRANGFGEVSNQSTRLTIRTSTVRYYNAGDAAAAAEVAALIGPSLPGGVAEARDFSDAPSRGAPGHLEVWIAGASTGASGRGSARSAPAPAIDPDQIRRLVESVISSPVIDDLGRGASDLARDIGGGAGSVARGIDAAVNDAVRALEGRP